MEASYAWEAARARLDDLMGSHLMASHVMDTPDPLRDNAPAARPAPPTTAKEATP